MNKDILVSIVVPVFNAEKYIVETLDSAFAQTYPHIEVICVDDVSSDRSVGIIKEYQNKLPDPQKLKLIELEVNSRTSVARNKGIEIAAGEFILPLDSDDKIDPTYIEKAISHFSAHPETDVFYTHAVYFDQQNGPFSLPKYNAKRMLVDNLVFNSSMFRKADWAKYGGYNPNMRNGLEDWDFWLNFTAENKTFFRLNENLFFYRKYGNSRSTHAKDNFPMLMQQIEKNHPTLYTPFNKLTNPYYLKQKLKQYRRWLIQLKLKKNTTIIKLLGIYIINKRR